MEHPCEKEKKKEKRITHEYSLLQLVAKSAALPDLAYLSNVAPRPLYRPAMPFSLSNCLVSCMAVWDLVSTVPGATVSGISFL